LKDGQFIIVIPTYEATSGSKTKLKLNNFEAYPLKYGVDVVNTTNDGYMLVAGRPSIFVFDGEYWVFAGQGFRTVYNAITVPNGIAATSESAQLVSPANLKQIIQGTTLTGIDVATSGTVSETDSVMGAIGKLQAQVSNIEGGGSTVDIPTKTSQLENDSGFITSIPSEYVTDTELNAKGYLTQHQDISGKADKSTTLAGYGITNAYTKTEVNNLIPTVPTKTSQLTNDSGFTTKSYVDGLVGDLETVLNTINSGV
jgi:hypothetical protein